MPLALRILLVEDSSADAEFNAYEVRKVLPACEFRRVETREDYLAALADFTPDVILCDYHLPRFDGLAALDLALAHCPDVPFILVTGALDEATAVSCMKAGAWDYILKDHLSRLGPAVLGALEQQRLRLENRRANEELRQSEERYRCLFEDNHAVMLLLDPESSEIVDANPSAAAFYGYSREQLRSKRITEINTLDADEVRREMELAKAAQRYHFNFRHRLANGTIRDVEVFSATIRLSGRALLLSIIHDVTERKTAETGWQLAQFCIDHAAIGMLRIDADGHILMANERARQSLGYALAELQERSLGDLDPNLTEGLWRQRRRALDGQETRTFESVHRRKDGTLFPVEVTLSRLDYEGQSLYFAFVYDIADRKLYEEEMRKLSTAVEQSPASVILTDPWGRIEYVNPKFTQISGYALDEVQGRNPSLMKSGETSEEEYRQLWETITAGGEWRGEFHNRRKDGSLFWESAAISAIRNEFGAISHFLAVKEDITERKVYEEQLRHLATHDELTGLANRTLLLDRLEQAIHYAQRSRRLVAVLLLDLDRFKVLNDSLGHSVGDELLFSAAQRLRTVVREMDSVARLGGDEFVILLGELVGEDDVGPVARKVLEHLTLPYQLGARDLTVTASLGISLYPRDGQDAETLLRNADVAMYRAKEEGGCFRFYAPEMNLRVMETLEMEADLRRALEREEFCLHYQPKVALATGKIYGAEALLRWRHPERGMVGPGTFIPLAEETGLILPIGEWVIGEVCAQLRRWRDAGLPVLPVAANLSARQFRREDLADTARRFLRERDLEPGLLEMELTESMIMRDPQAAVATMRQFKDLGVSLALDDFGTGYSSLNYLRRFPVDSLKIDRSFISDAADDPSAAAVVTSIVAIAHSLGLQAVAEGVETRRQLDFLRHCGCDSFQGFYFSRPLPAEDFAALTRQGAGMI